jgi:hypothetical protein
MRILARGIKLPNVAAVQCPHGADTRHHGRAVELDDQEHGFDRGLPLLEILLSLVWVKNTDYKSAESRGPHRRTRLSELSWCSYSTVGSAIKRPSDIQPSPLRRQAADVLRRARRLPVGHDRNNLRQLASGLLWLDKRNLQATVQDRVTAILALTDLQC